MPSVSTPIDEIITEIEDLDDWKERFAYLIELGDELTPLSDDEKNETNRVEGCVSNVWLIAEVRPQDPPVLDLRADSDSHLVRGLVAVLLAMFSGKTADEILACDAETVFDRLDLKSHLSRSRSNGLRSMLKRIRNLARGVQTLDHVAVTGS